MKNASLPILTYTTSNGWETLGYATTPAAARKVIMKNLCDHSLSLINRHNFRLIVTKRDPVSVDLNGGPDGFIYSIFNSVKK